MQLLRTLSEPMEQNAVAFDIPVSPTKNTKPEHLEKVKKRLESSLEKSKPASSLTKEEIDAKLAKAEEKRNKQLEPVRIKLEERRTRVAERQTAMKELSRSLEKKIEGAHEKAAEKRTHTIEKMKEKLQCHNSKVLEIKDMKEKMFTEKISEQKKKIEERLESAHIKKE